MSLPSAFPWRCPKCADPLMVSAKVWRCQNNHCFDVAKSGYVNLLMANRKASKTPGDSPAMLKARQAFLTKGHFDPIVEHLFATINPHLPMSDQLTILDIGCGEGYYLTHLISHFPAQTAFGGIDIAKDGLQWASKRCPEVNWVCASNAQLPVLDNSIDVLLRIFAPSHDRELRRVIKADGVLVIVTPGNHHLTEFKQELYSQVKLHQPPATPEGFKLVQKSELRWTLKLSDTKDVQNLLAMTPFYWRGNRAARDRIMQTEAIDVTAHMLLSVYKGI